MTVEFYQDTAGEYRWRVTADNGEIVAASSEGFVSMQNAIDNARLAARALANWALRG